MSKPSESLNRYDLRWYPYGLTEHAHFVVENPRRNLSRSVQCFQRAYTSTSVLFLAEAAGILAWLKIVLACAPVRVRLLMVVISSALVVIVIDLPNCPNSPFRFRPRHRSGMCT